MMDPVKIHFPINPIPKARARTFYDKKVKKIRSVTPTATRTFEQTIKKIARYFYRGDPFKGPVKVEVILTVAKPVSALKRKYPCVRPDIDNYQKAIFDALEGILWKDDGQVCDCHIVKLYGHPGITIRACEMR